MQGPSAAVKIPQPDTLSSPPLALREAPRRAGSAPNVRREIQRVQSLIGLRWCVFFMRSPGGCCLRTASSRHGAGLAACSKRAQFVLQAPCSCDTTHFHCGKDWYPAGSHKPGSRGSIPRPAKFSLDTECASLRGRVSKTQLARGSTGTPRHFPKMEAVVYQLALQAVNLPERVRIPSVSPSLLTGR